MYSLHHFPAGRSRPPLLRAAGARGGGAAPCLLASLNLSESPQFLLLTSPTFHVRTFAMTIRQDSALNPSSLLFPRPRGLSSPPLRRRGVRRLPWVSISAARSDACAHARVHMFGAGIAAIPSLWGVSGAPGGAGHRSGLVRELRTEDCWRAAVVCMFAGTFRQRWFRARMMRTARIVATNNPELFSTFVPSRRQTVVQNVFGTLTLHVRVQHISPRAWRTVLLTVMAVPRAPRQSELSSPSPSSEPPPSSSSARSAPNLPLLAPRAGPGTHRSGPSRAVRAGGASGADLRPSRS